jgi:hypothetical protein
MVLLLNLLPVLFVILSAFCVRWVWKAKEVPEKGKRARYSILGLVIIGLIYQAALPSHLPKGTVAKLAVPEFEVKEIPIKDLALKPMPGEERDARRKEQYKEALPFLDKKEEVNEPEEL